MKRILSFLVVASLVSSAVAQEEVNVPKDVLVAMSYFVGDWTYGKSDDAVVVRDGKWSAKWGKESTAS